MKPKKRTNLIYFISGLLLVGFFLFFIFKSNRFGPRDYAQIEKMDTLHIVTNFDQIGYFVSGDTIAGFNHDLLQGLQRYTKIHFAISVENSLEKSFEDLKSGKYDLIARNIGVNANLKSMYLFTNPIVHNKLILVQRKAEYNNGLQPIRSHLQLAKKTIYVPKDSPSKFRLSNLEHEIGDTIIVLENDIYEAPQLAMMVASHEIDYTVCDINTAQELAAKIPELDIKTDIGFTHLESWSVSRKSPVLLDSLNTWIDRFKRTPEYQKIYHKYYN